MILNYCQRFLRLSYSRISDVLTENQLGSRGPIRWASFARKIEEKKVERLVRLRNTVAELCGAQATKAAVDWTEVRRQLAARDLHFASNFEFHLLAAFDPTLDGDCLDRNLFRLIITYVGHSPAVQSNKIASTRFCIFLSQFPQYLEPTELELIRRNATQISEDPNQIQIVLTDNFRALTNSSADNTRYALANYRKFIRDRELQVQRLIIDLLLQSLLKFEMKEELVEFLREQYHWLNVDHRTIGLIMNLVSSVRITKKFTRDDLVAVLDLLSQLHSPIDEADCGVLVERILKQKLGYKSVQDTKVDRWNGECQKCGHRLTGLTQQEIETLKSHFRDIIFDKNDQYLVDNLSEYELQLMDFEAMLQENHDFQLVIDGLNVGYRQSQEIIEDKRGLRSFTKVYRVKQLDNQIATVLEKFRVLQKYQRILLLGRKHMQNWFQLSKLLKRHPDKIKSCFLLNKTRDDNFILLAAIHNPRAKILSNDYFRDHREKFEAWYQTQVDPETPKLGQLFSRWLKARQIKLEPNQMVYPSQFDLRIHLHPVEGHFPTMHIPVVLKEDPYNDDHVIGWICAQHNTKPTA